MISFKMGVNPYIKIDESAEWDFLYAEGLYAIARKLSSNEPNILKVFSNTFI